MKPLTLCDWDHEGIGKVTYQSPGISGVYCTSDCFRLKVIDYFNWETALKGRFTLITDRHGGVELIPK